MGARAAHQPVFVRIFCNSSRRAAGTARVDSSSERGEPGGTSGSTHGLGYLFTAFRRQGLIADELVLQLTTFLRSLDLFLELIVLTPGTLTANQVRHGGKQGTDNPELSRIHSSACLVLAPRETSGLKINYFFQTNRKMPHQMLNASSSIAPIPTTRTANATES
jgi:hypothetical protein